jgi:hypothetical protein
MTVRVHYQWHGDKRDQDFDSEQAAGIFLDGLYGRDDCKFLKVTWPHQSPY